MTIRDVRNIAKNYNAIEVYTGSRFHTDYCDEVSEYSDSCIVKSWSIKDEVLCILITGKKEMYAVTDVPITHDWDNEGTDHHIFEADNMEDIYSELIRIGATDDRNSIEEYLVDEDGEFWEGSNYDTPSNFRKRTAAERSVKDICQMAGMTQTAMADHFHVPQRTFGNWCTGTRECPEYTRLMMQELLGLYRR